MLTVQSVKQSVTQCNQVSTDGGSFSGDGILVIEYNRKLGDGPTTKGFSNVTCGSGLFINKNIVN